MFKRFFSFFLVLALVLVSILPGFVVSVDAATEFKYHFDLAPYLTDRGVNSATYTFTRSFNFFSWTYALHPDEFSTAMRSCPPFKFDGYGGPLATVFYLSPMRNASSSKVDFVSNVPFGQYIAVDDFSFEAYGLFVNLHNFTLGAGPGPVPSSNPVTLRVRFDFYDNMGETISSEFVDISNDGNYGASGDGFAYSEIPDNTYFFSFVIVVTAGVIHSGEQLYFDFDSFDIKFLHRGYPSDSTDPTSPAPTSPTVPSFDDSGIINSVGSAADKVIEEIGGDISDQTDIITDAIGEQTGQIGDMIDGVQEDLEDINKTQQDLLVESEKTNETLSDTLDEVKSLPEKIMDGIKGLFVPDEEDMQEYNNRWDELLHSRFGALYESVDIIGEVGSVFTSPAARSARASNVVEFPSVTIPLAGTDFTFGGWSIQVVPDGFDVIVDMLKTMISLLATVAFINALRNKFDHLMEGS